MGYTKSSTKNADYTLHHGLHGVRTVPNGFGELDCTILETGVEDPSRRDFVKNLLDQHQYSDIIAHHMKTREPAFITESPAKGRLGYTYVHTSHMYPIAIPAAASLLLPVLGQDMLASVANSVAWYNTVCGLSGYTFLQNKDLSRNKLRHAASYLAEISMFYLPGVLRDAITAEKAENFVAPEMAKRLGRKPKIGVVFGAGHHGMRALIENPRMRNFILRFHKMLHFDGLDTDYFNRVYELGFFGAGKDPEMTELETSLFRV